MRTRIERSRPFSREHGSATPGREGRALQPPRYGVEHADRPREHNGIREHENLAVLQLSGGKVDLHARGASLESVSRADPRLRSVGARSYARGPQALVGDPADRGHELWHLAQQAMGQVQADSRIAGRPVAKQPRFEREADRMGEQIASFRPDPQASSSLGRRAPAQSPSASAPIQGVFGEEEDEVDPWAHRKAQFKPTLDYETFRENQRERVRDRQKQSRADKYAKARGLSSASPIVEDDPEIEDLISAFSRLTLTFTDGWGELHAVYPDLGTGDVIVASNPTPLKSIIAAKKWEKIAISHGDLVDLHNAQTDVTAELANYGKSRSKATSGALRKALEDAKDILESISNIPIPAVDLSGSTNHGNNAGSTEGIYVVAAPLSIYSTTIGSPPSKDGRLMTAIRKAAPNSEGSSYKQMHLLNDNTFGPGELWNLTPGPAQSNSDMEHGVETNLKAAIYQKAAVMTFAAKVDYKNDPNAATATDIDQNPNNYRFNKIDFAATQWVADSKAKKYKPGANVDAEVAAIDGASVTWKWGSLTPLVPKPKILSTADVQELVDAGIPKPAATRIVAFTTANAGWTPVGKADKKGQLADAIASWDGKRKISTTWNASAVLWS
ncbi:hypothetical protein ACNOYE_13970 [Nannocystaceae bacterium ST9]